MTNIMNSNLDTKKFKKILLLSSLPVVLQNLLQNSLSFIDTLMIGQLGETEIAAAGLTNQMFFLITVILFGVTSGASIFTSQFWGNKDEKGFQKTIGVALFFALSISLIFTILSIFTPGLLMHVFVNDPDVVQAGSQYLRWVGISYLFIAISQCMSIALRSTSDMVNPMRATLVSMVTNVIGNYFLIFTANLGITGAAIATTISRFIELCILIFFVKRGKIRLSVSSCFAFDSIFLKKVLKTALPVLIDDTLWAMGMTVYKAVYARMGIGPLAASNVSESMLNLAFVLQNGLGAAIAVLIGNEIGRGEEKNAQLMAKLSILVTIPVSLVSSIFMALVAPFVPLLFNVAPEVQTITKLAILALSITLPIKFINHVYVVGILRSGGDTKFLLFTEFFSIWCVGVPMAYLSGLVLMLPLWAVYFFVTLEEVAKACVLIPRCRSGTWITNLAKS